MSSRTLFEVLEDTAAKHASAIALYQPTGRKGAAKYKTYTFSEYCGAAREIACGLRSIGVGKGDVVALYSETRAEFYLADFGVVANGSIAAAMYTSLPPADHVPTLASAKPKAIFVEDEASLRQLQQAGVPGNAFEWIVLTGEAAGSRTLERLREEGRAALQRDPELFDRIRSEFTSDDPAVLYMTSGATGLPKMGLVTHHAIVSNIEMGPYVLPLTPKDSTLAFLPSAHIAQRVVIEFLPVLSGTPVYFSEGLTKMPVELREIRPTFLLAPPRVWERVFASIQNEVKKKPPIARKLFHGAVGLGLKAARLRHEGKPVPGWMEKALGLADKVVFTKIRARLGGRLRMAASGAAPLGRDLAQFYEAIGLPLVEGYGLTEGGVTVLNPIGKSKPGSIGKPLPGCELKLAEDGELLVKAPCLFSGYWKDPESTAAVLRDGWLHTGDLAEIDSEGYIFITGRKKELIVSSNGKKIYPARIETLFKLEPLVSQVLLIGDRQPYVTALITINTAAAETLKGGDDLKGQALEQIAASEAVYEEVQKAVKRVNRQLAPFEQIKRFRILERDFSIDRGELTPTMKVRRTQVIQNFRSAIDEMYLGREEMV